MAEGRFEEPAGERLVVDPALDAKEAVEGAPVRIGQPKGDQSLSYGVPGEDEQRTEEQRLRPEEGALLMEGAPMSLQ